MGKNISVGHKKTPLCKCQRGLVLLPAKGIWFKPFTYFVYEKLGHTTITRIRFILFIEYG